MCCKSFWIKIIAFSLAMILGLLLVNSSKPCKFVSETRQSNSVNEIIKAENITESNSSNPSKNISTEQTESVTSFLYSPETEAVGIYPVRIISESPAKYTEMARQNRTQGIVVLRVAFLGNGKIGGISVVKDLPFGLTEQAVSAAKKIEFEPLKVHGMLKSSVKTVIYTFTIY